MARKSTLLNHAPPFQVETTLTRLGTRLRIARLRRNLSVQTVAEKIGVGTRAVLAAERGRPGTGIAVYLALLWAYDLLSQTDGVADPALDAEALANLSTRQRAALPSKRLLDNDF